MSDIYISGKRIDSVFQLLGDKEDDISYSVSWALSRSNAFLKIFLESVLKPYLDTKKITVTNVSIHLQKTESKNGRTDVELHQPGLFFLILEAKRGWVLPELSQLQKYAERKEMVDDNDEVKKIVVVSECSDEYSNIYLPAKNISGVDILHFSWKQFHQIATKAKKNGNHAEKRLLDELKVYLQTNISMQRMNSNWVYVVSLGSDSPAGWNISWRDIVSKRQRYFHPVGNRWPKEPVNYIAFRYDGRLQSIHFVKDYKITTNFSKLFSEAPKGMKDHEAHFVYELDSAILPPKSTPNGNSIKQSTRVRCMLDTLLTYPTITDAYKESCRRWDIMNA